ncbi:uncharacterized protein LOC139910232 [Centroberyx gerrardi]|uniref:uncharacterized protein isoform X2 n=1 Tax=Centroberyx gerrardi TaxID=166262 RepID=UPI003AAC7444
MELQEMKIFIFFIVMSSAATEEIKKNLTCTEGGSITLPDPVVESGLLLYGKMIIAVGNNKESNIMAESFRDRLLWHNNTRLFTITGLQTNDSGTYTIASERGFSKYALAVYKPAPRPGVNRSRVSTDSCTLVCFVEKAHETTLYWIKGEEILNQTSTGPSLPLTVDKQDFNSSYRCVAANPADEKTFPVNVKTFCSEENNTDETSENNRHFWLFLIRTAVFLSVIAITITGIYFERKRKRDRQSQGV